MARVAHTTTEKNELGVVTTRQYDADGRLIHKTSTVRGARPMSKKTARGIGVRHQFKDAEKGHWTKAKKSKRRQTS